MTFPRLLDRFMAFVLVLGWICGPEENRSLGVCTRVCSPAQAEREDRIQSACVMWRQLLELSGGGP